MSQLEARLPDVFDSVADGLTVLDRSGRIRFANHTAAEMLGRASPSELIGSNGGDLMAEYELLAADGAPLEPERMPTRRVFAGEPGAEETVRFRRRGSLDDRWSRVRSRLLPGASSAEDLVVTAFQDITSLMRSERRLRLLAEASALLGESIDYKRALQQVADIVVPQLADWCVVDVLEWTRGVTRVAIAHADAQQVAIATQSWAQWPLDAAGQAAMQLVMERRKPVLIPDLAAEGGDEAGAQEVEHLAFLRPLKLHSVLIVPIEARGEVLGALTLANAESGRPLGEEDVGVAVELGRRAGAAIDSARLVWEAQENARLREEFIAVASHDMRTPLAAVRGYAQLALRRLDGPEGGDVELVRRWLHDIDSSVDRLAHLVSELLDASLVRADQAVPLQLTTTTLGTVLQEVVERYGELSDGHRFSIEVAEDEPVGLWDRERLARVVENLVGNAIKFSPDGGEVRLQSGMQDGRSFIAVSDQGIGIPASDLNMIFNPMYRGGNVGHVTGTGLGLSGSRRLIELMGGTIEVASELGRGSTFTVWLPMVAADGDDAPGI
jgi:PAS domain S-box-containing protein